MSGRALEPESRELRDAKAEIVRLREVERLATEMMLKITTMKIDGWLDGEYNLKDQRELLQSAKDFLAFKEKSLREANDE